MGAANTKEYAGGRIRAERDGAAGRIVLNQPARLNAMSFAMWQGLDAALGELDADPAIAAIVLTGAGDRAFCTGDDISEFADQRASADAEAVYKQAAEAAMHRLAHTRTPTIAMIRGYCIGGGVETAITCDLRIASDAARFAIPAARLGLGYDWHGIARLVALVGPSFAKEIFFTARQFAAAEALAMGLVDRVVPDRLLEAATADLSAAIADAARPEPIDAAAVRRALLPLDADI